MHSCTKFQFKSKRFFFSFCTCYWLGGRFQFSSKWLIKVTFSKMKKIQIEKISPIRTWHCSVRNVHGISHFLYVFLTLAVRVYVCIDVYYPSLAICCFESQEKQKNTGEVQTMYIVIQTWMFINSWHTTQPFGNAVHNAHAHLFFCFITLARLLSSFILFQPNALFFLFFKQSIQWFEEKEKMK